MCEYECSFPRITKYSFRFNMCSENCSWIQYIAQGSIVSPVMYMYVVFVICLYYLIN